MGNIVWHGNGVTINGSKKLPLVVTASVPFTMQIMYTSSKYTPATIYSDVFSGLQDSFLAPPFSLLQNTLYSQKLSLTSGSGFGAFTGVGGAGTGSFTFTIDAPGLYAIYFSGSNVNSDHIPIYVYPNGQASDVLLFFMSNDGKNIHWVEERDLNCYSYANADPANVFFPDIPITSGKYQGPVYTASLPTPPQYSLFIPSASVVTGSLVGTFDGTADGIFWGTVSGTIDETNNGNFLIPEEYFYSGSLSGNLVGTLAGIFSGSFTGTGLVDGYIEGTVNGVAASGSSLRELYNGSINGSISGSIKYPTTTVSGIYNLEEVVRTADRRIRVYYSLFNPVANSYELLTLNSVQY